MAVTREVMARSLLCKSGISDYCINCYTGCLHGCIYCYARFMKRFSGHEEPWGEFLDIKVNAPDLLAKEAARFKRGLRGGEREAPSESGSAGRLFSPGSGGASPSPRVFVSSVCDAYQPAEKRYNLTRECLKILVDAGFHPAILTKSKLVTRDFDILEGHDNCEVGCTLTTMDEELRSHIEPGASPTRERIAALEEACSRGITAWAFLGPFMPGLSDTDEALDALFSAIAQLPLARMFADKLNPRPGVWNSIVPFLNRWHPEMLEDYRRLFFDAEEYRGYCEDLGRRLRKIAEARRVGDRLKASF